MADHRDHKAHSKTGTTGSEFGESNLRDRYCETETLGLTTPRHDTACRKRGLRTAEKEVIEPKSDKLIFFRFSRHKLLIITTDHRVSAMQHTFRLKVKIAYSRSNSRHRKISLTRTRKLFWNNNFLNSKIKFETTVKQN